MRLFLTGWWAPALEEQLEADFVVVSMTPSPAGALPATLLQVGMVVPRWGLVVPWWGLVAPRWGMVTP